MFKHTYHPVNEIFVDMTIRKESYLLRFYTQFIIDLMYSSNDVVRHSENNRLRFDLIDKMFQVESNYILKFFFALLCPLIIVMPDISIILLNGIDIYWLFANRNKIQNATNVTSKGNILKIVIYTAIATVMINENRIFSIISILYVIISCKRVSWFYQSTFQWITHEWDAHEVELNMFYWIVL